MNRILLHLGGVCPCERRRLERERLDALAKSLEASIDIDGIEVCAGRFLDDDGEAVLRLSLLSEWKIEHEATAREEIIEALEIVAGQLQAAVGRLEGGVA